WLVSVFRHDIDGLQRIVITMRLSLAGDPVQHEVSRRHEDHHARVSVERILARAKRLFPDTAFTAGNAFAVTEGFAGNVFSDRAVITNDHADVSDGHDALWSDLDRREPAVDKIRAVRERHILPTAPASC